MFICTQVPDSSDILDPCIPLIKNPTSYRCQHKTLETDADIKPHKKHLGIQRVSNPSTAISIFVGCFRKRDLIHVWGSFTDMQGFFADIYGSFENE